MATKDIGTLLEHALRQGEDTPKNARERSRAETHRRLMAAWLELTSAQGSASVSIREIAEKAQVSVGAFYCHFKGKEELNGEVALNCFARLIRELDKMTGIVEGDTELRLTMLMNVLMDFVERYPLEAMFLWRSSPVQTEEGRAFLKVWEEFWEQRISVVAGFVFDNIPMDPSLDRDVLARAIWGIGERLLSWWIHERDHVPREVVMRTFSRFVAKGLAPDA